MKYAWLENPTTVRDVCDSDPVTRYTPEIAAMYDTQVPDEIRPGATLENGVWVNPPTPTPQPEPLAPEIRHITVGAFFDRFGDQKWPILADTNAGVQALIKDASVRAYINLDDSQVRTGLEMVVAAGHTIDVDAIITAPIQPEERP